MKTEKARHLARSLIGAASRVLSEPDRTTIFTELRAMAEVSEDKLIWLATTGTILPDEDERTLQESLALYEELRDAIDIEIGKTPVATP